MSPIHISIINQSSFLKPTDIEPVVSALNIQVSRDFTPVWHTPAQLSLVTKPTPDSWWIALLVAPAIEIRTPEIPIRQSK